MARKNVKWFTATAILYIIKALGCLIELTSTQTEPREQGFSDLTDFQIWHSFFCQKVSAIFCFRNKCQERFSIYFGQTFSPEDCMPLQLPDYCLFRWVAPICYDSRLIYHQPSWLQLTYGKNEEVMSMLVSLYYYYIISPNLGSHSVIV